MGMDAYANGVRVWLEWGLNGVYNYVNNYMNKPFSVFFE